MPKENYELYYDHYNEMKDACDRLLLMDKMSDNGISTKTIDHLKTISSNIRNGVITLVHEYLLDQVIGLNKYLATFDTAFKSDLEVYWDSKNYCFEVKSALATGFRLSYNGNKIIDKGDFELAEKQFDRLRKELINKVQGYIKNKNILISMHMNIYAQLKSNTELITFPDKLFITHNQNGRHLNISIDYKSPNLATPARTNNAYDLDTLIEDENALYEKTRTAIFKSMAFSITYSKATPIREFMAEVAKKYNYREIGIPNYVETSEKPYDFTEGYINVNKVRATDKVMKTKMEQDIVNSIAAVLFFENSKFMPGKINIRLGSYCFYFVKEVTFDNDTYALFECQGNIGKGKKIRYIYKNGVRVSARARRKILNKMIEMDKKEAA